MATGFIIHRNEKPFVKVWNLGKWSKLTIQCFWLLYCVCDLNIFRIAIFIANKKNSSNFIDFKSLRNFIRYGHDTVFYGFGIYGCLHGQAVDNIIISGPPFTNPLSKPSCTNLRAHTDGYIVIKYLSPISYNVKHLQIRATKIL